MISEPVTRLTFKSPPGDSIQVQFEPIGTLFSLTDGELVVLQLPVSEVSAVEVVVWRDGGVSVWVPYQGYEYVIFDGDGREVERL
jgi:hypothetical protein